MNSMPLRNVAGPFFFGLGGLVVASDLLDAPGPGYREQAAPVIAPRAEAFFRVVAPPIYFTPVWNQAIDPRLGSDLLSKPIRLFDPSGPVGILKPEKGGAGR